jgi:predicted AlkP superfamily pyrophosphatase or phosphodiesterase
VLQRRGISSAVWHAQNIKDAAADFIVTPAPIHEADGTTKLWCYSKPDGLYQRILDAGLGHFPLHRYWGPLANIESTQWILKAALWLIEQHQPRFHWVYVPHLDYAGQKFGPNSPQAQAALAELDAELGKFAEGVRSSGRGHSTEFLVAGEYAMTDVSAVVHPNRILREAGLLSVKEVSGAEHIDLAGSAAFAMVDHQFAHVYVKPFGGGSEQSGRIHKVAELFKGKKGIAAVYAGNERKAVGLDHERAGEVILISEDDHWLAYYWWLDDAVAPPFARTVDIHNKPGYDPAELFFDPATKSIPLNASLVKGSHGVPATAPKRRTALIHSAGELNAAKLYRDSDIKPLCLSNM